MSNLKNVNNNLCILCLFVLGIGSRTGQMYKRARRAMRHDGLPVVRQHKINFTSEYIISYRFLSTFLHQ